MVTVPPPYSPLGMVPSKVAYSIGWSSVCTARWFLPVVAGGPLGTAQDDQHAVVLQPEVVVQAACVVLLDHEACRPAVPPSDGRGTGSGVLAGSRMER